MPDGAILWNDSLSPAVACLRIEVPEADSTPPPPSLRSPPTDLTLMLLKL